MAGALALSRGLVPLAGMHMPVPVTGAALREVGRLRADCGTATGAGSKGRIRRARLPLRDLQAAPD